MYYCLSFSIQGLFIICIICYLPISCMTLLKSNILSTLTGWCWAKFFWPWCRPFSDFAKAVVAILIWKNEVTIRNRNVGLFKFFPTVLVDFVTE